MKKFGFTLTEVMITVGIIGVIAALTIPNLVANYQKNLFATSLHRVYNDLDSAIQKYMADQHVDDLRESDMYNNSEALRRFITSTFDVAMDCGTRYYNPDASKNCFAPNYGYIEGFERANLIDFEHNANTCNMVFMTTSGASLCVDTKKQEGSSYGKGDSTEYLLGVEIDVNGPQGPNIFGRDLFMTMHVQFDGTIKDETFVSDEDTPGNFFGRLLNNNWKMNY